MNQAFSSHTLNRRDTASQRFLDKQRAARTRSRPADNLTGKEVVTRSSKWPLVVNPLLEATPKELSDHRIDKHRRLAHWISDKITYATGPIDGFFDAIANGIGELIEDGAFFVSKTFHGAKHGWARGKFKK